MSETKNDLEEWIGENDLLSWLDEQVNAREQFDPERHITYRLLMERHGFTRSQATTWLQKRVNAGQLAQVDIILPNGRPGVGFVRVDS